MGLQGRFHLPSALVLTKRCLVLFWGHFVGFKPYVEEARALEAEGRKRGRFGWDSVPSLFPAPNLWVVTRSSQE